MTNYKKNHINKSGYIIIINTLIFMTVSVILLSGVVNPILSHYSSAKGFMDSKKAFQLANSASEEVMYRLRTNKNLTSPTSITLDSGTANISIATADDTKTITIDAVSGIYERNIVTKMIEDVGVSFSYGLQAGKGGLTMGNHAYISGNVYSNGDITGGNNGSYITGSAIVANSSNPTAHVSNGTTTPPTNAVNFGGSTGTQDFAQSFTVSTTTTIASARFYIKKQNMASSTPLGDISVKIVTDSPGSPYRTVRTSGNLSSSAVTSSYNYITVPFTSSVSLTPGTTYWIVLDANTATPLANTNYYSIATSIATYSNGLGKIGTWSSGGSGGTWSATSPAGQDSYFDIYVGGDFGVIDSLDHIGTGSIGDAWAHTVENVSSIKGTLYCQTSSSIGGGKTCNTTKSDPVEQPFPVSDGNINTWKEVAEAGGTYNGNKSYPSGTSKLGPQKIDGNLTVDGILELTGTVYVTGNVTIGVSAELSVDSTFGSNSGILVADGRIVVGNNALLEGSGTSGSYILLLTTSDCPASPSCSGNPAIDVNNNSEGSSLFNAQKGKVLLSNNATTKEVTAHTIELAPNTNVTYETGIADTSFVSGPSGSWYISSWDEVE